MQNMDAAPTPLIVREQECPVCHALIPVYREFIPWCDQCNWNMLTTLPQTPPSRFATFYERLGRKMSKDLFEEVMAQRPLKPTLSVSILWAYGIATLVHLVTLGILGLGIYLLIAGWPNPVAIFFGLVGLLFAWMLRPYISRMPKEAITAEDDPTLYSFVDRISDALQAQPIMGIVISPGFNASFSLHAFSHFGLAQEPVLTIGLPFFSILSGPERVAILAHELAHGVNGDPQRRYIIHYALDSLLRWAYLVRPQAIWSSNEEAGPFGPLVTIVLVPVNFVLLGLANFLELAAYCLLNLLYRESQRAEYIADHLAARVAGSEHLLSALEKMYCAAHLGAVTQRFLLGREEGSLFTALQQGVSGLPERERERLRRSNLVERARLDVSHPPTVYRVAFLNSLHDIVPSVTLSPEDEQQLDECLARYQPGIQKKLAEAFKYSYY